VVPLLLLGILAGLFYPAFRHALEPPHATNCRSNAMQLGTALAMYVDDYDRRFPPHVQTVSGQAHTLPSRLGPYLKNDAVWNCPLASGERTYDRTPRDTTISYGYNLLGLERAGVGVRQGEVKDPEGTVAFAESTSYIVAPALLSIAAGAAPPFYPHPAGCTITWVDGHARWYLKPELESMPGQEKGKPLGDDIDAYPWWNRR
jgi:prepilin-type processing-associated H-X9-DG protein